MHDLLDAERDATLAYLDELTCRQGGRRGRAGSALADVGVWCTPTPVTPRPGPATPPPTITC